MKTIIISLLLTITTLTAFSQNEKPEKKVDSVKITIAVNEWNLIAHYLDSAIVLINDSNIDAAHRVPVRNGLTLIYHYLLTKINAAITEEQKKQKK